MIFLVLSLTVVVLLAIMFYRFMTANHNTFQKMNIDTQPTFWLTGNFVPAFKLGICKNQVRVYNMYKDKKVYGVYLGRKPNLVVRDLDMIKEITVKNFNNFVNRQVVFDFEPPFKDNMLVIKDDQWKHVRNVVSPTFSSGRIKRMSHHIERNSKHLVDILRRKQEMNESIELKTLISHFTLDVIASTGFGLEINTVEDPDNPFAVHARNTIKPRPMVFVLFFLAPWLIKLFTKLGVTMLNKDSLVFFAKAIDSAMESRKETGQVGKVNDFMDLLINAEKESGQYGKGALTRSEVHGQVLLFILAGYDTVSTVLSFTMFLLANHPECCQLVQKEIDEKLGNESPNCDNVQGLTYMEMCINEAMRMFPPGFIIDRVCTDDIAIQGFHIPKGMVITLPIYAIHHDPDIYPDPYKFQPERFSAENKDSRNPYAFLPFGHGPRNCIGMRLALVELKVAMVYLLKSFTPVPCEKTVYPVELDKFQMKAKDGLWVKWEQRK